MRKMLKGAAAVLALSAMASDGLAAASVKGCAGPSDMIAIKTAAVQQKLMVAALSCNAVPLYNRFVTTYRKDLQASDRTLENFFRRRNGKTGSSDYHAFKTHLANASSMQSIGNMPAYCQSAKATFEAAFAPKKADLAAFITTQPTSADNAFAPCQVRTAQAAKPAAAKRSAVGAKPRGKPVAHVVPAQGGV